MSCSAPHVGKERIRSRNVQGYTPQAAMRLNKSMCLRRHKLRGGGKGRHTLPVSKSTRIVLYLKRVVPLKASGR